MRFALAVSVCVLAVITDVTAAQPLEVGKRRTFDSTVMGETRPLLIHLPESYQASTFRYPVLYLLDADAEFLHTVGIVEFLASTDQMPEVILVGVPNTLRSRDLTPESANEEETVFWPEVGGADRFRRFFAIELIPFIDSEYRTEPYRILRGQSFGGLFAIHDYMSDAPTFHAYLTSSPAVGWNFGHLIDRAANFFAAGVPRSLYVSAAKRDFPGNLRDIERFRDVVETVEPRDRWRYDFFENESHYSLVHLSTYRALRFLYQHWQVPDAVADSARFDDYQRHYAQLSSDFGYPIAIPMKSIIRLGNHLLRQQRFEEGIRVHERNLTLYPDQPEGYWHVGDAYRLAGRVSDARPFFELALKKAVAMKSPDVDDYRRTLAELDAER